MLQMLEQKAFIPKRRWTSERKRVVKWWSSCRKWRNADTGQFKPAHFSSFSFQTNVTSERPVALRTAVIRWWEWQRAPWIQERKKRSNIRWNAAERNYGGAGRAVPEALLEIGQVQLQRGSDGPWSGYLGCGSCKNFEKLQLKVVSAWAMHFGFPQRILLVL